MLQTCKDQEIPYLVTKNLNFYAISCLHDTERKFNKLYQSATAISCSYNTSFSKIGKSRLLALLQWNITERFFSSIASSFQLHFVC